MRFRRTVFFMLLTFAALPGFALGHPGHDHNDSGNLFADLTHLLMSLGQLPLFIAACVVVALVIKSKRRGS